MRFKIQWTFESKIFKTMICKVGRVMSSFCVTVFCKFDILDWERLTAINFIFFIKYKEFSMM